MQGTKSDGAQHPPVWASTLAACLGLFSSRANAFAASPPSITSEPASLVIAPGATMNLGVNATGESRSLFIKRDGTLWSVGDNGDGQMGDGTAVDKRSPVVIASNVVAVAAGANHKQHEFGGPPLGPG